MDGVGPQLPAPEAGAHAAAAPDTPVQILVDEGDEGEEEESSDMWCEKYATLKKKQLKGLFDKEPEHFFLIQKRLLDRFLAGQFAPPVARSYLERLPKMVDIAMSVDDSHDEAGVLFPLCKAIVIDLIKGLVALLARGEDGVTSKAAALWGGDPAAVLHVVQTLTRLLDNAQEFYSIDQAAHGVDAADERGEGHSYGGWARSGRRRASHMLMDEDDEDNSPPGLQDDIADAETDKEDEEVDQISGGDGNRREARITIADLHLSSHNEMVQLFYRCGGFASVLELLKCKRVQQKEEIKALAQARKDKEEQAKRASQAAAAAKKTKGQNASGNTLSVPVAAPPRSETPALPPSTLRTMMLCLSVVELTESVGDNLEPQFSFNFINELRELVQALILELPARHLKEIHREAVPTVHRRLVEMLEKCINPSSQEPLRLLTERFKLDFALKQLRCPYLDRRLQGLNELRDAVNAVQPNNQQQPQQQHRHHHNRRWEPRPVLPATSAADLCTHLSKNGIVEELFGPNMHVQLLQRAKEILLFMAHQALVADVDPDAPVEEQSEGGKGGQLGLRTAQLDMIWDACRGKHETVTQCIHPVLGSLAEVLHARQARHLFSRIAQTPRAEMGQDFLTLVRQFCFFNMRRSSNAAARAHLKLMQRKQAQQQQSMQQQALDEDSGLDSDSSSQDESGDEKQARPKAMEETASGAEKAPPVAATAMCDDDDNRPSIAAAEPEQTGLQGEEAQARGLGLMLLWDIFNGRESVAEPVRSTAFSYFKDALMWPGHREEHSDRFLQLCLGNLDAHWNVPHTLELMRTILDSYVPKPQPQQAGGAILPHDRDLESEGRLRRAQVIAKLENSRGLTNLIYSDLILVANLQPPAAREVESFAQIAEPCEESDPFTSTPLVRLQKRLDFVIFLHTSCPLNLGALSLHLTYDALVNIWKIMHFPTRRDILYSFLTKALTTGVLPHQTAEEVFLKLVPTLNFTTDMSQQGFSFFRTFFRLVNTHRGSIAPVGGVGGFEVVSIESIVGESHLWELALGARMEPVFRHARDLLDDLHTRLAPQLQSRRNEKYQKSVALCLDHLQRWAGMWTGEAGESDSEGAESQQQLQLHMDRCLSLLQMLINSHPSEQPACHRLTARSNSSSSAEEDEEEEEEEEEEEIAVKVRMSSADDKIGGFTLWLRPHYTALVLRARIAARLQLENKQVALTFRDEPLTNAAKLRDAGMYDGCTVHVAIAPGQLAPQAGPAAVIPSAQAVAAAAAAATSRAAASPAAPTEKTGAAGEGAGGEAEEAICVHPAAVLAQPHGLELLFHVLSLPGLSARLADKVWRMLMRLPTSPSVRARLAALGTESKSGDDAAVWDDLSDQNAYKLHYSLQIVSSLLGVSPDTSAAKGDNGSAKADESDNGDEPTLIEDKSAAAEPVGGCSVAMGPEPPAGPAAGPQGGIAAMFASQRQRQAEQKQEHEEKMQDDDAEEDDGEEIERRRAADAYTRAFLRRGGAVHLVELLLAGRLASDAAAGQGSHRLACVALLLDILRGFFAEAAVAIDENRSDDSIDAVQADSHGEAEGVAVHAAPKVAASGRKRKQAESGSQAMKKHRTHKQEAGSEVRVQALNAMLRPDLVKALLELVCVHDKDGNNSTGRERMIRTALALLRQLLCTDRKLCEECLDAQATRRWLRDGILCPRTARARQLGRKALGGVSKYWREKGHAEPGRRALTALLAAVVDLEPLVTKHQHSAGQLFALGVQLLRAEAAEAGGLDWIRLPAVGDEASIGSARASKRAKTQDGAVGAHGVLSLLLSHLRRYPVTETSRDMPSDQVLGGIMSLTRAAVRASCPAFWLRMERESKSSEEDSGAGDRPLSSDDILRAQQTAALVRDSGVISRVFEDFLFRVREVQHPCDLLTAKPTSVDGQPALDFGYESLPPHCKTDKSRQRAFDLLLTLARTSPSNHGALLGLAAATQTESSEESGRYPNFSPEDNRKSATGYVGLLNLGATCYLNSLMQQLFMVPEFRYGVLMSAATDDLDDKDKEASVLYQLQRLFATLQESETRFYDTSPFCEAYKDWDGNSIQHGLQMDVNEFFNVLFDKLEASMKGKAHAKLLDHMFGGKITNQLICQECPHRSERDENYYILSLEVKNKRSILQSLDLYVEGEMLEGDNKYFCQTCHKKVDTLKRCCIKTLPRNLILHLKRFEFDYDTMMKVKIDDYCEFPTALNLRPYSKEYLDAQSKANEQQGGEGAGEEHGAASSSNDEEGCGMPDSYFQYTLAGVLVHTGTCNSGHYYSYIKEREPHPHSFMPSPLPSDKEAGDGEDDDAQAESAAPPGRWLSFNDMHVDGFDASQISDQCFGGELGAGEGGGTRGWTKPYSAYMLFYQRVEQPAAQSANVVESVEPRAVAPRRERESHTLSAPSLSSAPVSSAVQALEASVEAAERAQDQAALAGKRKGTKRPHADQDNSGDSADIVEEEQTEQEDDHDGLGTFRQRMSHGPVEGVHAGLSSAQAGALVPPELFREIRSANADYLRDLVVFNPVYGTFCIHLARLQTNDQTADAETAPLLPVWPPPKHSQELEGDCDPAIGCVRLGLGMLVHTLYWKHNLQKRIAAWVSTLTKCLAASPRAAQWLCLKLVENPKWLWSILLKHKAKKYRDACQQVILAAIASLRAHEVAHYGEVHAKEEVDNASLFGSDDSDDEEPATAVGPDAEAETKAEAEAEAEDGDDDGGDQSDASTQAQDEDEDEGMKIGSDEDSNDDEDDDNDDGEAATTPAKPVSVILQLLDALLALCPLRVMERRIACGCYWDLLQNVAQLGPEERAWMTAERGVLGSVARWLTNPKHRKLMDESKKRTQLGHVPALLTALFSAVVDPEQPNAKMTAKEQKLYTGSRTVSAILVGHCSDLAGAMDLANLCVRDKPSATASVAEALKKVVEGGWVSDFRKKGTLNLIRDFANIDDSLRTRRRVMLVKLLLEVAKDQATQYPDEVIFVVSALVGWILRPQEGEDDSEYSSELARICMKLLTEELHKWLPPLLLHDLAKVREQALVIIEELVGLNGPSIEDQQQAAEGQPTAADMQVQGEGAASQDKDDKAKEEDAQLGLLQQVVEWLCSEFPARFMQSDRLRVRNSAKQKILQPFRERHRLDRALCLAAHLAKAKDEWSLILGEALVSPLVELLTRIQSVQELPEWKAVGSREDQNKSGCVALLHRLAQCPENLARIAGVPGDVSSAPLAKRLCKTVIHIGTTKEDAVWSDKMLSQLHQLIRACCSHNPAVVHILRDQHAIRWTLKRFGCHGGPTGKYQRVKEEMLQLAKLCAPSPEWRETVIELCEFSKAFAAAQKTYGEFDFSFSLALLGLMCDAAEAQRVGGNGGDAGDSSNTRGQLGPVEQAACVNVAFRAIRGTRSDLFGAVALLRRSTGEGLMPRLTAVVLAVQLLGALGTEANDGLVEWCGQQLQDLVQRQNLKEISVALWHGLHCNAKRIRQLLAMCDLGEPKTRATPKLSAPVSRALRSAFEVCAAALRGDATPPLQQTEAQFANVGLAAALLSLLLERLWRSDVHSPISVATESEVGLLAKACEDMALPLDDLLRGCPELKTIFLEKCSFAQTKLREAPFVLVLPHVHSLLTGLGLDKLRQVVPECAKLLETANACLDGISDCPDTEAKWERFCAALEAIAYARFLIESRCCTARASGGEAVDADVSGGAVPSMQDDDDGGDGDGDAGQQQQQQSPPASASWASGQEATALAELLRSMVPKHFGPDAATGMWIQTQDAIRLRALPFFGAMVHDETPAAYIGRLLNQLAGVLATAGKAAI